MRKKKTAKPLITREQKIVIKAFRELGTTVPVVRRRLIGAGVTFGSHSGLECPVAQFLKMRGCKLPIVGASCVLFGRGRYYRKLTTPPAVKRFILRYDRGPAVSITTPACS